MIKKFPAWCKWCKAKLVWDEKSRQWHRTTPNKTFEDVMKQVNCCPLSPEGTWHDPDPSRPL